MAIPTQQLSSSEAFKQAEANIRLEGFEPTAHPLYEALKQRVIRGEMSPEQMSDAVVAYAVSQHHAPVAA